MSRPDWCPEDVWEKAVKMASEWEGNPEMIQHMAEDFAPALLSAKREGMEAASEIAELHRHPRGPEHEDARWTAGASSAAAAIRQKAQEIGKS